MDALEELLYSSASEALSTIGESAREAFIGQLRREGIQFSPDRVDLSGTESKLYQFFGSASPVIIEKIYDVYMRNSIDRGYVSPDAISNLIGVAYNSKMEMFRRIVDRYSDGKAS